MWRGISLANKCLLLFGAAVVLIILAALSFSFLRVNAIVQEGQRELSEQLMQGWLNAAGEFAKPIASDGSDVESVLVTDARPVVHPGVEYDVPGGKVVVYTQDQAAKVALTDPFIADAWRDLTQGKTDVIHDAEWTKAGRRYRLARLLKTNSATVPGAAESTTAESSQGRGLIVLDRVWTGAVEQALANLAYMFSAGLISLGLAVLAFYLITTRLILSPVRQLKETAELVREGNTGIRADIHTGDEFQELGETFNQMLEAITASQQQLRAINVSLDLKVNELAERNISLFEANRLKGEFLASVSHELRTPLNSIIGFAELLQEQLEKDAKESAETPAMTKRRRYLDNIVVAGKNLLELINGLLDMAKLEAGKVQLRIEPVNLSDLCEALIALIRPLADRGGVELAIELGQDLPLIETDGKKLQQILFNLLSNAVKFTSEKYSSASASSSSTPVSGFAKVTLRAERLFGRASQGVGAVERVRLSVLDTGPGISPQDQQKLFEKFSQLDSGHTRKHAGTGLGLAICKELTGLLQGEIQVDSELGRGSMFSVILPLKLEALQSAPPAVVAGS